MLFVNQLVGLNDRTQQTTCSFLQLTRDDSNATTYTFTAQSIGGSDARRYIVAAVAARAAVTMTLNSVSIGGTSAVQLANGTCGFGSGISGAVGLFSVYAPSSTTSADVVATFSTGCVRAACALFRVISDYPATVAIDSKINSTLSGGSLDVTLGVPNGGIAIAAISSHTSVVATTTWSGVTESYDQESAENTIQGYSGGFATYTSGTITISATISGSATHSGISAASFR